MASPISKTAQILADQFDVVDGLVRDLLELPAEERAGRLDALADRTVASAVAAILDADEADAMAEVLGDRAMIPDVVLALTEGTEPDRIAGREGQRVGAWRLGRVLGEGGMGVVYEAERADGAFEQRIAVKFIRLSASPQARRRFERERRLLARLDHPNVAGLLDGGLTEQGEPYLAMEYIEGEAITTYADRHRLGVRARVALLRTVCRAVQHAHGRLVVHRDLKPSNVLVAMDDDGQAIPKLLDFGVAMLASEAPRSPAATRLTEARAPVTPPYAAPEQLRGDAATTLTDVYGLGVLAYELLSGARPYSADYETHPDALAARRALEEATVRGRALRPSARVTEDAAQQRHATADGLAATLRGDLDAIVLKAMAAEPERRYGSAESLAEDIDRYIQGLPVLARAPTWRYQAGKFMRRHWGAFVLAAVVLALGAGGIATLVTQRSALRLALSQAETERDRAAATAARQQKTQEFVLGMLDTVDPNRLDDQRIHPRDLLKAGADSARVRFADEALLQAEMLRQIGARLVDVWRDDAGIAVLQDAVVLLEAEEPSEATRASLTLALASLGYSHKRFGRYVEAERLLARSYAMEQELPTLDEPERLALLNALGDVYEVTQRPRDQRRVVSERLALIDQMDRPDAGFERSRALTDLASVDRNLGLFADALARYGEVLALRQEQFAAPHDRIATIYARRGQAYAPAQQYLAAIADLREAIGQIDEIYGPGHRRSRVLTVTLWKVLLESGRYEEAEALYPRMASNPLPVAEVLPEAARLAERGAAADAMRLLDRAYAAQGEGHERRMGRIVGPFYAKHGMWSRAHDALDYAVTRRAARARFASPDPMKPVLAETLGHLGREQEAKALFDEALGEARAYYPEASAYLAQVLLTYAGHLHRRGQHEAAHALLTEAEPGLRANYATDHPRRREARALRSAVERALDER